MQLYPDLLSLFSQAAKFTAAVARIVQVLIRCSVPHSVTISAGTKLNITVLLYNVDFIRRTLENEPVIRLHHA